MDVTQGVGMVLGAAGICVALGAIWKFVGAMAQLVTFVRVHTPILVTIAKEFQQNGGRSLKDQIDRIELGAAEAGTKAEKAREQAVEASREAREANKMAIETAANVRQILRILTPKVRPEQIQTAEIAKEP